MKRDELDNIGIASSMRVAENGDYFLHEGEWWRKQCGYGNRKAQHNRITDQDTLDVLNNLGSDNDVFSGAW